MKIAALAMDASQGWPPLRCDLLAEGLNVFHGPAGSGKTTLADMVTHALFGRRLLDAAGERVASTDGELVVVSDGRGYRLRRYFDHSAQGRLTVAALDGTPVDRETVRQFLSGLSPSLAGPIFALRLGGLPALDELLSEDFFHKFLALGGKQQPRGTAHRKEELSARRDALAEELAARIAGQQQEARVLDHRWHELDQLVRQAENDLVDRRERLRAAGAALAEVETQLRYLELEATLGQQSGGTERSDTETRLAELDDQIARWRTTLAESQHRETSVRAELAQVLPDDEAPTVTLADQRAWLTVARQWAADLSGEVARLARATESETCVCRDAHPRLRPIAETIARQLDVLDSLVEQQQRAARAAEFATELGHLGRSQVALSRQLEHLLERRQTLVRGTKPSLRPAPPQEESGGPGESWRDMQQLDQRRWQLEREQSELREEVSRFQAQLRDLQSQRDAADRQRAGLLSGESIEDLQQQLATVQQELERAAAAPSKNGVAKGARLLLDASDYVAQLTSGGLVGVQHTFHGEDGRVVNRDGESVPLQSLNPGQQDLVTLSLCLAYASACGRRGIHLPLVLDEPFAHVAPADVPSLAAVLDDFGRHGQQILMFTGQPAAVERLTALGVAALPVRCLQSSTDEPPMPAQRSAAGSNGHREFDAA